MNGKTPLCVTFQTRPRIPWHIGPLKVSQGSLTIFHLYESHAVHHLLIHPPSSFLDTQVMSCHSVGPQVRPSYFLISIVPEHFCATVVLDDPSSIAFGVPTITIHQGGGHYNHGGRNHYQAFLSQSVFLQNVPDLRVFYALQVYLRSTH